MSIPSRRLRRRRRRRRPQELAAAERLPRRCSVRKERVTRWV